MEGGYIMEILVSPVDVTNTNDAVCDDFTVCIIRSKPND